MGYWCFFFDLAHCVYVISLMQVLTRADLVKALQTLPGGQTLADVAAKGVAWHHSGAWHGIYTLN